MKIIAVFILALALTNPFPSAASDASELRVFFEPAKGFKPAQQDLTEIFLQIAGSLEHYGSPVPYLRHIAGEHERIQGLYRQKLGKQPISYRPSHMTDKYLDRFSANWTVLSAKLNLAPFTKEVGHLMRDAILGTRGRGVITVEILNRHQARVFDAMTSKNAEPVGFAVLKADLIKTLELDQRFVNEWKYEIPRRDAVTFALAIRDQTNQLFAKIETAYIAADAAKLKSAISCVYLDVGLMAHSELEAGLAEWAFEQHLAKTK
jgi:hypothetical protein